MNIVKNIYKSVFSPLEIINRKSIEGKLLASLFVVLVTALFGSVLAPALYYSSYKNKLEISISAGSMLTMFLISVLTWIAACGLFWLLSVIFRKQVGFKEIISTWGFSYVPNFMCIIAYSLIQLTPGIFNGIFGFLINTFFIMLLVWKAIYFFIEMRFVIRTTVLELFIITLVTGIVFMLLMWIGFSFGIQVPML
jgi:hypothetical protein